MPTYDYRCTSAGHRFELFQSFGDEGGADCPVCGSSSERVISAVAVHFKGSGFYKTDNASSRSRGTSGSQDDSEKPKGSSRDKASNGSSSDKQSNSSSSDSHSRRGSTKAD